MNILIISTYPISNPVHGGQLRVSKIVSAYEKAGHHVEVVGVLGSESYEPEAGFLNFPGSKKLTTVIKNPFLMEDYAIGRLFSENENLYESLASLICAKPDVVQVEHPWMYSFGRKLADKKFPSAQIVYSSHNIEWRLKKDILSTYLDSTTAAQYGELVKEIELAAIHDADAVLCVSEDDAKWVRSQAAKNVVLAPNGVKAWKSTDEGLELAARISQGNRYALYCASAHPPNMTGFFEMFGGGFGSLKPNEKLVLAGNVGWAIAGDERVHKSAKLAEKVVVAGVVSQPCLEGLLDGASCIVLPLTQGGGTNLKTAEALWSGKHIVATKVAMRGFEEFIGAKGVHIADDPSSFKRAIRTAMESEPLSLTQHEISERRSVLWESCLSPLLALINKFEENRYE